MRIGLFGGSFNPIHNAHVALARTIRLQEGLDEVWFMVSPHNPLKKADGLADEQRRLHLTRLALQCEEGLVASDYEFHLEKPSYTWKTLQALRHDYPQHEFCLIIGGDNWVNFPRWAHYEEIMASHDIIVYPRENSSIDESMLPKRVKLVQTTKINITSTMLRDMLCKGEDISPYVHPDVAADIRNNPLF